MGFIDNPQSGANMGKCQNLLRLYSNFALFVRIWIELDGYPYITLIWSMVILSNSHFLIHVKIKKKPRQPL